MTSPSLLSQLPRPPEGRTGWPWTEETPPAAYAGRADWPRLSIVTPSFGQAAYIEETLRSILLQNYPDLQLIVMDGGSTDGTVDVLKKYSPWIHHWESERDRGQSHAINKGIARCDGVWFNWINSDDCLLPGGLAAIAGADPAASILVAAQTTGAGLGEPCPPARRTHIGATLEDTAVNHFICQQGMFLRTDLVKSLNGVREELHYVMDLDLFIRALLEKGLESVRELPVAVAFFRRHEQAKTSTATAKFIREERRLFHGLGEALALEPRLLRHVADTAAPLPPTTSVARLDHARLGEALAIKFWWEGSVEVAWREQDFLAFKRELREFRQAFPRVGGPRQSRLSSLALLPTPLLRLMSRFRAPV